MNIRLSPREGCQEHGGPLAPRLWDTPGVPWHSKGSRRGGQPELEASRPTRERKNPFFSDGDLPLVSCRETAARGVRVVAAPGGALSQHQKGSHHAPDSSPC